MIRTQLQKHLTRLISLRSDLMRRPEAARAAAISPKICLSFHMALEHTSTSTCTYLVQFLTRLSFESVCSCLCVLHFLEIAALFYILGIYGQHFFLVDFSIVDSACPLSTLLLVLLFGRVMHARHLSSQPVMGAEENDLDAPARAPRGRVLEAAVHFIPIFQSAFLLAGCPGVRHRLRFLPILGCRVPSSHMY